ncbi:MAG: hypothetical protein ACREDF_10630 [Thermoplasmata archaeon]
MVWAAAFLLGLTTRVAFDDLTFIVETDKADHARGEEVLITTNLTNRGPTAVTLSYGDSCGGFAAIRNVTGAIWFVTPSTQQCLRVITEITIDPGQRIVESFLWLQQDLSGNLVPFGSWSQVQAVEGSVRGDPGLGLLASSWFYIRLGA